MSQAAVGSTIICVILLYTFAEITTTPEGNVPRFCHLLWHCEIITDKRCNYWYTLYACHWMTRNDPSVISTIVWWFDHNSGHWLTSAVLYAWYCYIRLQRWQLHQKIMSQDFVIYFDIMKSPLISDAMINIPKTPATEWLEMTRVWYRHIVW